MKRSKKLYAALLAFVMLFGLCAHGTASPQSDKEYISSAAQSVLLLVARDNEGNSIGYGSGFVIIDNYTLVTSYHLVKDADWIDAYNSDDDYYYPSKVIAADEKLDIALLEFFSPTNLKPIPQRPFEANLTSGLVTAIGGPHWVSNDIASGAISTVQKEDGLSYIEFEADLTQMMDGGVLVDLLGQASGMIMGPVSGGKGTYRALDIQEINRFAQANWEQERMELYDYFHKDDAVKDKIDEWLADILAPTPTKAPTPKAPNPTETPAPQRTDYFLRVGDNAYWDMKNGYWQVNPKVVNDSKILSVDRFTLSYYCQDESGEMIRSIRDGGYVMEADFDMVIGPGEEEYPGYTRLTGYENVKSIHMAISQIHVSDDRTIDIPMEEWQVMYIVLE